jgi:hypothetical protein
MGNETRDPEGVAKLLEMGCALHPFVSALLICRNGGRRPEDCIDSGTCGFVHTGTRELIVTARHVLDGFPHGEGGFARWRA